MTHGALLTFAASLATVAVIGPMGVRAQDKNPEITEAEAIEAARSIARYCKILIERMDDTISDAWATQDLQDLAAVWDSLDCHQVFGVDERVRWLVR